jgi:hypothetical protein
MLYSVLRHCAPRMESRIVVKQRRRMMYWTLKQDKTATEFKNQKPPEFKMKKHQKVQNQPETTANE